MAPRGDARAWAGFAAIVVLAAGPGAAAALEVPAVLNMLEKVTTVSHGGGGGLWIHEGYAYSSGLGAGFFVTDVRDPSNPVKKGALNGPFMRDVDVLETGGKVVAVTAADGGGMRFLDVTNPDAPTILSRVVPANVHNIAVVPGTSLVYNSRGGGGGSTVRIDIVDGANPASPVLVKTWSSPSSFMGQAVQASSCHDIHVAIEVHRAYCAGGRQTLILDIADPLNPAILGLVSNADISYHHWAFANAGHNLLVIGDEDFDSGGARDLPNCLVGAITPVVTVSLPEGALWFYDIRIPSQPKLLSWIAPPEQNSNGACTAHFGELIPGKEQVAVSWYRGGISIVDFTVPVLPRIVAQYDQNVNAWDVRYHDGHLFTGDINRGMDVLRIVDGIVPGPMPG